MDVTDHPDNNISTLGDDPSSYEANDRFANRVSSREETRGRQMLQDRIIGGMIGSRKYK